MNGTWCNEPNQVDVLFLMEKHESQPPSRIAGQKNRNKIEATANKGMGTKFIEGWAARNKKASKEIKNRRKKQRQTGSRW